MQVQEAYEILLSLHAPARLVRHAELVLEASTALISGLKKIGIRVDEHFVYAGAILHDCGKSLHPEELHIPGAKHELAGKNALLGKGVEPDLARVCVSHAQWNSLECIPEELLIALADKLWKGVRLPELEEAVLISLLPRSRKDRWELLLALDDLCEKIADAGPERLSRSVP